MKIVSVTPQIIKVSNSGHGSYMVYAQVKYEKFGTVDQPFYFFKKSEAAVFINKGAL